jgi:hypothetical protein
VFNGAPKIKIKIKINSADQKTADFVSEKDVRATAKTKQSNSAFDLHHSGRLLGRRALLLICFGF